MQPTLCSRCKKNVAVIFITRIENGESHNEGLCLRCARELHIKPVDEMMEKLGISDTDLDNLTGDVAEMLGSMGMLGGDGAPDADPDAPDADTDEDDGKTATFPFLNRLFNQNPPPAADSAAAAEPPRADGAAADKRGAAPRKLKFLNNYCIDLTQRARDGKLDAMVGRAEELERVIQILNRRQKNNPCLIGEPGVGKTAIAEGLAQRIAEGNVPYKLRDKQVYLLDLTALVAGTQFRGQFESRMKGLIEEIRRVGNIILVIDEVHNIVGAGDAEGSMNAANILKPALSRGEIQVIGATTFAEYRKHIEKDAALERRFQPVTVAEPSIDDSVEILKGVRRYYEDFHGVVIPDAMCRLAVVLSERYITDRFLPDKAIDLVDEACAMIRTEIDSMPSELDDLRRRIMQMEIEEMALKKEDDQLSRDRLEKLTQELAALHPAYVYVPVEILDSDFPRLAPFLEQGAQVVAVLPRVITDDQAEDMHAMLGRAAENGVQEALVGNMGHIFFARRAGMRVRGDFGLNVFNSFTEEVLQQAGLVSATASFELRVAQIRDLAKSIDTEMIVYGRLPCMITEQCIIRNSAGRCNCKVPNNLADRRGALFPVLPAFGHRNQIFNAHKLYLADKHEDYETAGLWGVRLMFTTETPHECVAVTQSYLGLTDYRPNGLTRGLYYRGVE